MNVRPTQPGSAVRPYTPSATKATTLERGEAVTRPAPDTGTSATAQTEQPRGMLRLLEDGHFNGVASARLHLNSREERATVNLQQRIASLSDRFAEFADDLLPVELHTDDMGEGFAGILSTFDKAALTALNGYDPADAAGAHALQENLQSTFEVLRDSTLELFGQELSAWEPSSPAGVQGAPSDEAAPAYPREIPSPLAQFMTELASTFSETMHELSTYVSRENASPPLSEARGEEAAYDKLIAEYNSFRPEPGVPHTEQLNIQA